MICYHFILEQNNKLYRVWSNTLNQYNVWLKLSDTKVYRVNLIKHTLDENKLTIGYYHEEIK